MKSRNVTVTSKNQITLPADLVRKYRLNENRVLEVREQNGALLLRPSPTLEHTMKKHWDLFKQMHPDHVPPSGQELDDIIHDEANQAYRQGFKHQDKKWYT